MLKEAELLVVTSWRGHVAGGVANPIMALMSWPRAFIEIVKKVHKYVPANLSVKFAGEHSEDSEHSGSGPMYVWS